MRSRQPEGTETGARFDVQQPKQIRLYREACARAGRTREPGVSASRSIFVLINEQDRM